MFRSLPSLFDRQRLINSFPCDSDSTLGTGEYSFLIYTGQMLILYNIDGPLHQQTWNTLEYDSIKQIRWSSYHRAYLIMTARMFFMFVLFNYHLLPWKSFDQALQIFACHQMDLWFISLSSLKQQQIFYHWELDELRWRSYTLDQLGLHRTDTICAIECHPQGSYLAMLVAERNRNITVGVQRRRRLMFFRTEDLHPMRTIYFSGADDLFWTMTFIPHRTRGWLLSKWFDRQLTLVDDQHHSKMITHPYPKEIRNLAMTIDGHYLIVRTVDSLDIYEIYSDRMSLSWI